MILGALPNHTRRLVPRSPVPSGTCMIETNIFDKINAIDRTNIKFVLIISLYPMFSSGDIHT